MLIIRISVIKHDHTLSYSLKITVRRCDTVKPIWTLKNNVNTISSQILRSPRGCCVFPGRDVGSKRSVQTADINKHGWHISTSHYCTEIKPQIPEISAAIWWCHLEPGSAQQRSGCGAVALSFQPPNSIMSRIRLSITPLHLSQF